MVELSYYGHSFFKIKDKKDVILIDPIFDSTKTDHKKNIKIPVDISKLKDASLILITNEANEHFDKEAVQKIANESGAIVVAHDFVLNDLNLPRTQKTPITSNYAINLKGINIQTKTAHYPQSFCPTGFLIDIGDKRIYHAGKTKLLDSFSDLKADVAILPMSSSTMDVVDVVRATKLMKPDTLIPMQHDVFEEKGFDSKELDKRIKDSILKTKTLIIKPGKKVKL
jgi:L-ascorbate metabolism protein UlaG (beta-lactamase superfamily)